MTEKTRLIIGFVFAITLFVSSVIPAFAASTKDGSWRIRPIIVLCESYPTICPCPTC